MAAVAGGNEHSLALDRDGGLWGWGSNAIGALGGGSTVNAPVPRRIDGLPPIRAVGSEQEGDEHVLAIDRDGRVWAWGRGSEGQLGSGEARNSSVPRRIAELRGVSDVAAGENHSLALDRSGRVWSWGHNADGQLGQGGLERELTPRRVPGLDRVVDIGGGGDAHSIALRADGTVWTWGSNASGQIGNAAAGERSTAPVAVTGLPFPIARVAAGGQHSLALDQRGRVWSWGGNDSGQLGDGTLGSSQQPVLAVMPAAAVAIAAGQAHSLALLEDGTVLAWGWGERGQLGGCGFADSAVPVPVPGLAGIVAIACGDSHSLAVGADGSVWAWGANGSNQLGDGSGRPADSPVRVWPRPPAEQRPR